MDTRQQLLMFFEKNKGLYFSGEELARRLSVSRTAVWKAVKRLQHEGYRIDAVPNRGYRMPENTDILSAQGIEKYLQPHCSALKLKVYPVLESTNREACDLAARGETDGCVVLAMEQSKGRGRLGRSFYSPPDSGIYMSLLLRPQAYTAEQALRLTTMAAVAICEAIEDVVGEEAQIKWVNDIYMREKKVCGILTEASFSMESGLLDYAVVGIGVNVYDPADGFPEELQTIAGSVFNRPEGDGKNRLAAAILNRLMARYHAVSDGDTVEEYRRRSFLIGRKVWVRRGDEERAATVLDVDQQCRLVVQYKNGEKEALFSGEVRLRWQQGDGACLE